MYTKQTNYGICVIRELLHCQLGNLRNSLCRLKTKKNIIASLLWPFVAKNACDTWENASGRTEGSHRQPFTTRERRNTSALAIELRLSCISPSTSVSMLFSGLWSRELLRRYGNYCQIRSHISLSSDRIVRMDLNTWSERFRADVKVRSWQIQQYIGLYNDSM